MQKIWFFVEGDSEEEYVTNIVRRHYYEDFLLEKDIMEFVGQDINSDSKNICYCENCSSVDKIPHRINELSHLIRRSGALDIFIVCDVEKLNCCSKRKEHIENIVKRDTLEINLNYIFFNPMIENHYWDCPELITRMVELEYKRVFNTDAPEITIPANITHTQKGLKNLFSQYNVKYRESKFANRFFPRIDYNSCQNDVLKRTRSLIELLQQGTAPTN